MEAAGQTPNDYLRRIAQDASIQILAERILLVWFACVFLLDAVVLAVALLVCI